MKFKARADWGKTAKGFSAALGYAGEHLTGWAREWMAEAMEQSLKDIDSSWPHQSANTSKSGKLQLFGGDRFHPWFTGSLHDSVAGVVSDNRKLIAIRHLPQMATNNQTYKGSVIVGADWGERKALDYARLTRLIPGIQAFLVVGVPYAEDVNESSRHAGFIDELGVQFVSSIEDYFTIKAGGYRTRVFVADKKGSK